MKDVMKGLEMTMESKEDFDGIWLPTLDVSLAVSGRNRIMFKHYEKPICSNLTMQRKSAMEHNVKVGIMANEVIRRLLNIGGDAKVEDTWEAIDSYTVKQRLRGGNKLEYPFTEQLLKVGTAGIRGE